MLKFPANFEFEQSLWSQGVNIVAGLDEVGRGAWAGPVVAGAVIFPTNFIPPFDLYDSKLLTAEKREEIAEKIYSCAKVGIGTSSVGAINSFGVGKATQRAFRSAVKALPVPPDHFLIDAFYINHLPRKKQKPIKKGDLYCASIAAASIVAKVFRDSLMREFHSKYPKYGFDSHKGYGTKFHQGAIKEFSFSPIHRKSFDLDWLLEGVAA